MKNYGLHFGFVFLFIIGWQWGMAQNKADTREDRLQFHGQFSGWTQYNINTSNQLNLGARYIPEIQYQVPLSKNHLLHFDASVNLWGVGNALFSRESDFIHHVDLYRFWVRYTTSRLEIRLGLQKINFGSANLLRPLMWFDKIDPRDPLHLSTGVYGALMRYYFSNNANLWIWALWGNKTTKGWETIPVNSKIPEFGGRFQWPLSNGEVALSYHHRTADSRQLTGLIPAFAKIGENRYGFDIKLDLGIGWWLEGTLTTKNKQVGFLTHQEMINTGIDYSFGIGNGLNVSLEQLLTSYDQKVFCFENPIHFTALSASYPTGVIDNLQAILYYDWSHEGLYRFVNWSRQYNKFTLYLMVYWNPENYQFIYRPESGQNFAGKGIQIMIVYNH